MSGNINQYPCATTSTRYFCNIFNFIIGIVDFEIFVTTNIVNQAIAIRFAIFTLWFNFLNHESTSSGFIKVLRQCLKASIGSFNLKWYNPADIVIDVEYIVLWVHSFTLLCNAFYYLNNLLIFFLIALKAIF